MLMVHGIWSISTPIALVEASVPDRAWTPWLGRVELVVVSIGFLFGASSTTAIGYQQDHYLATIAQFAGAALVVVLLAVSAFLLPTARSHAADISAPSAWLVGAVALVFASAALFVPKDWGWGAVATLLALDAFMLVSVIAWSRHKGWRLKHQLALGAGAALAYGWHAFLQHPAVGGAGVSVRVGNATFLAGAIALIWFASRRARCGASRRNKFGG